jgi:hypothetical protein
MHRTVATELALGRTDQEVARRLGLQLGSNVFRWVREELPRLLLISDEHQALRIALNFKGLAVPY